MLRGSDASDSSLVAALPGRAQPNMILGFKARWKMPVEKETAAGELFQRPDCTND